jgi:hypothetical protein
VWTGGSRASGGAATSAAGRAEARSSPASGRPRSAAWGSAARDATGVPGSIAGGLKPPRRRVDKGSMRRAVVSRWIGSLLTAGAVSLVFVAVAVADKQKIQLTKAGQAAARSAVLTRADLGTSQGWTGGAKKPSLSSEPPCANFNPKQSDLVLIGAAETVWKNSGLQFDSEAQVLKTPTMVGLDWQRTVLAPQVEPCLRGALSKQVGNNAHLVSFGRLAFPKVATYTRAYRALVDVNSGSGKVRVLFDVVLAGRGRTEVTLTTSAPYAAEAVVSPAEVRLARLLASRARG